MDSSASEKEKLRSAYCPPVDDATFLAIASDYELPRDREILVAVLDTLKDGALEQENTDFDPSGTGGPAHARDATDTSRSSPGDTISNGVTSITTGLSELRWHETESLGRELEDSTLEQKTAWLLNIFPDIPRRELASVLQSHDGDLDKATDELLNLSFLMQGYQEPPEPVPVLKSVDAFAEGMQPSRKGRKSKRNRTNESSRASSVSSSAYETGYAPSNVWSTMSEDTVRSVYHANGARLPTTIRALAAKEAAAYDRPEAIDPIIELQISEFQTEFEQVPKSVMYGLLILARKIPSAAHELLEAMTAARTDEDLDQIRNAAHYTPLDLKDDTPWESPIPTRKTVTASSEQISAAAYRAAATQNFNQATSAWKKSKSDRLYGGAAAYYAEVGRERASAARALHAAEADTLVSRQSSSNVLDLHGVSVQDAVRIASSTTQRWWDGLGDAKYVSGGGGPARAGFRIVTGVGTHSKNHAPRIGPAVSKMLIREGWKIEIGHGELIVTGKIRR
ncbi:hypothetical protein LTR99_005484 [Exophiala xenobiotica]|uniref:Smr domain-containing protein n=1 Tax=Vermiconidia calcicola TaxID=1690605 RepID=A0AAV9Q7E0_9PEZI|nr:hypothetical protein LTR92_004238 [Exophiala xenobiotica]KAK5535757.1 hypothetical protein LTR25_005659 [Vermiconidia calcicola]KAK5548698.1 hypothetical protein LTR23_001187 [Chaetothyriales sp. CCFEE 6169]KAK5303722.1 hypothetical protein LTR99_005484 [Exophiala xenobiotica]KAK5339934.1 hypothetical protein LTR98_004736 [Exophiala xenobiotica]